MARCVESTIGEAVATFPTIFLILIVKPEIASLKSSRF